MTGPKPCITNGGILLANSMFWPCSLPNFPGSPFMGSFRLPLMLLPQAVGGKVVNSPTVSTLSLDLIGRCDPNRTVGDRILVHVEWLKHGHGLIALLAVPERPHIVSTFPLRDRIPRIGIILVPKQPLPLQPLHLAANFQRFLEGCLEGVPLAR